MALPSINFSAGGLTPEEIRTMLSTTKGIDSGAGDPDMFGIKNAMRENGTDPNDVFGLKKGASNYMSNLAKNMFSPAKIGPASSAAAAAGGAAPIAGGLAIPAAAAPAAASAAGAGAAGAAGAGGAGAGMAASMCFIFAEANNGILPWYVVEFRKRLDTKKRRIGYFRMSRWLVPLMRTSPILKKFFIAIMTRPMSAFAAWFCGEPGFEKGFWYLPIVLFWIKIWDWTGTPKYKAEHYLKLKQYF